MPKQRWLRNVFFSRSEKQKISNWRATLYEILLVRSSTSKGHVKNDYHLKMNLLTHPDKEFFEIINQLVQFLPNDAAQEAYHIVGVEEAEKVLIDNN